MTPLLIAVLLGTPAISATIAAIPVTQRWAMQAAAVAATEISVTGVYLSIHQEVGGSALTFSAFRVDRLAAFMLIVIGLVSIFAVAASNQFLDDHFMKHPERTALDHRTYWGLLSLFLAAMTCAVISNNLGITWVSIEATTIATTFLVGFKRTPLSLEAAWKYAMICSFGIAIALLGVVILYFDAVHVGIPSQQALNVHYLMAHGARLDVATTRLAIGLMILGFGAKAGLVPLHSWLPDAHSQAPPPVSALMSGVLLSVGFSVVLRVAAISNRTLGVAYASNYLLAIGTVTTVVAALLIWRQKDLKRLLAQSSIEQMGFITFAAGISTDLAVAALLLHVLVHGIGKSLAFISAGRIETSQKTTEISHIKGLLAQNPLVAFGLLASLCLLVGLPPFGLFFTETAIVTNGAKSGLLLLVGVELSALLVASVAMTRAGLSMTLGDSRAPRSVAHDRTLFRIVTASVTLSVVVVVIGSPTMRILLNVAHGLAGRG